CRPRVSRPSGYFKGMIEVLRIVENPLAGIAGDDLIVLADFLKDLRPDSNLADLAHFIPSRSHTDPAAMLPHAVVLRNQIRRDAGLNFLPLLEVGLERAEIVLVLVLELLALFVDARLIFFQPHFSGFDVGLTGLGFHHQVEYVVLDFAYAVLSVFDL